MSAPTARSVALDVIGRVIDEGAYSNRLLPSALARSGLDDRDRAFATELALGTLRRRLRLDPAIADAASRPLERIAPPVVRHVLRLGAYQLLEAGVAPHAAVSTTVDLAPARARGFVNAVMRRLASRPPPEPTGTDPDAIAVRTGLAPWAVEELGVLVGDEREAAAAASATRAPLCLRVVGGADSVPDMLATFAAAGVDASPAPVHPACILVARGDPRRLPGFDDGRWIVQDQASAFVSDVLAPSEGDTVYDVCAAPGGKTVDACEAVGARGHVISTDVSVSRLQLVARAAARLDVDPVLVAHDATAPAVSMSFDRVLVDAPCSGIGSSRRRPELLWRVSRDRLSALAARQLAIATRSADLVRPGGRLVYSVCTFPRAETDAVCDALLRARSDLVPLETEGRDGRRGRHRLWPHRHGCDGMFVAAFERVSEAVGL
jgi:16S rRNA (cytosine967-C5)-methyltransferase